MYGLCPHITQHLPITVPTPLCGQYPAQLESPPGRPCHVTLSTQHVLSARYMLERMNDRGRYQALSPLYTDACGPFSYLKKSSLVGRGCPG